MTSSLNPENMLTERDRWLTKGHGTSALGPSDTSDSGSDVQGGFGLDEEVDLPLDYGTTSDPDRHIPVHTAGPDVGDANLDSDSDAAGTGERASAGRDVSFAPGRDIDVDHIESIVAPDDFEHDESDGDAEPEREDLERHVALLRPQSIDPDTVEELARRDLGYAYPNDLVQMNPGR